MWLQFLDVWYLNCDCTCIRSLSRVRLFVDCRAHWAPLPVGFSREELEWVAISSSRGSSWPRDWIRVFCVSCIAGGFFTAEPLVKTWTVATFFRCLCLKKRCVLHSLDSRVRLSGEDHGSSGLLRSYFPACKTYHSVPFRVVRVPLTKPCATGSDPWWNSRWCFANLMWCFHLSP